MHDLNTALTDGLLEIKCPDKDSFEDRTYLYCKADGTTHEYYFQMVNLMGITSITWCEFFVRCKQDDHLEHVYFNLEEWTNMKSKLDIFFFTYFLPALYNKGT